MDDKNAEPEAPPKTVSAGVIVWRALGAVVLAFAAVSTLPYAFREASGKQEEARLRERHVFLRTPEGYKPVPVKPANVPLSEVFELHCNRLNTDSRTWRSEVYVGPLRAQYEAVSGWDGPSSRYTYFSVDMGNSDIYNPAAGQSLATLARDDRSISGMSLADREGFGRLINNACNNAAIGYPVAGDVARLESELVRITASAARRNAEQLERR